MWTPLSNPPTEGHNYYKSGLLNRLASSSAVLGGVFGKRRLWKKATFSDHSSIAEVEQALGREVVGSYFKFCFDRNPWDFAVSLYFHHRSKGRLQTVDFEEFVFTCPIPQNATLYSRDRKVTVDAVFRYEELEDRLADVCQRLQLSPAALPTDKSHRRPPGHYRQYYSQTSRDEVANRWQDTIRLLNYDF